MKIPWSDGPGYYAALSQRGLGVNYMPLVGHGLLRLNVMGYSAEPADETSLRAMGRLLEAELDAGAWGFSTGLAYMPGCFADFKELRYLAEITAEYNGVYTSHIRNQGNELLESVDEAICVAEETGVAVIISHLKAYGPKNWGKAAAALERMAAVRKSGLRVMADFYPYDSSESTLMYELPEWAKAGGAEELLRRLTDSEQKRKMERELENNGEIRWDRVIVSAVKKAENRQFVGKTIASIAEENGMRNFDIVAELLQSEQGGVSTVCRLMGPDDVDAIACADATAVGSDGYALPEGKEFHGHPRNWGAFPHFYNVYVKQKGLLKPEQAVYKMSGMAAEFLGVPGRGFVKEGYKADLVLCDPERLEGRADYETPDVPAGGIDLVMINGQVQFEAGTLQRKTAGKVIIRNGGK
jgi:N-acyl-D-aspartate/D-glutamate deacylase